MPKRPVLHALLASVTLAVVGLSGCADPTSTPAAAGNNSASGVAPSSSASPESHVTTTWNLQPVDSVTKLIPGSYKGKTIKNAIYNDFPPQEFIEDGHLVGIQPDIALALSEVMGVKIDNASVGSFDVLIPGLSSGRYDISSADFGITKPRLAQVDFVSQFEIGTGFATKTGSGVTVQKQTDLCGHTVGLLTGSYYIDQITQASSDCEKAGLKAITVQTYPNDGARILAISNGRSEITATNQDSMSYVIKAQQVPLTLQPFTYQSVDQGIALKKGSDLAPALKAAMAELVADGTYGKIMTKWGVESIGYKSADKVKLYTDASQVTGS